MDDEERRLEQPEERIERLVQEGRVARSLVDDAIAIWLRDLAGGVTMPNGEIARVTRRDLAHLIADPRILRHPARIRMMIDGVQEIRTSHTDRRVCLCRWDEGDESRAGILVLDTDGRVRSAHVVGDR